MRSLISMSAISWGGGEVELIVDAAARVAHRGIP
jgi:hypothetical protein